MPDYRRVVERELERVELRPFTLDGFHARLERKRRNQRIAAGAVAVALFAGASLGLAWALLRQGGSRPAGPGPAPDAATAPPVARDKIAFVSLGDIWLMSPDGTDRVRLTDEIEVFSAPSWSPDGTRMAFSGGGERSLDIYTINADGTDVVRLTGSDDHDHDPAWSPDGARIAFVRPESVGGGGARDDVYVINADGTELRRVRSEAEAHSPVSWSADGTAILFFGITRPSASGLESGLYAVDVEGGETRLLSPLSPEALGGHIALSPDGTLLAFTGGDGGIYVMNADGSGLKRLTDDPGFEGEPTWSPDGTRIAFVSGRDTGQGEIYVMNADGSEVTRLTHPLPPETAGPRFSGAGSPAWSPVP